MTAAARRRAEEILDAAERVVARHGAEHMTTSLVAAAMGASIGALYVHYPDRIAILLALGARNRRRLHELVEDRMRQPASSLHDIAARLVDAFEEGVRSQKSFPGIGTGSFLDFGKDGPQRGAAFLAAPLAAAVARDFGWRPSVELLSMCVVLVEASVRQVARDRRSARSAALERLAWIVADALERERPPASHGGPGAMPPGPEPACSRFARLPRAAGRRVRSNHDGDG